LDQSEGRSQSARSDWLGRPAEDFFGPAHASDPRDAQQQIELVELSAGVRLGAMLIVMAP